MVGHPGRRSDVNHGGKSESNVFFFSGAFGSSADDRRWARFVSLAVFNKVMFAVRMGECLFFVDKCFNYDFGWVYGEFSIQVSIEESNGNTEV